MLENISGNIPSYFWSNQNSDMVILSLFGQLNLENHRTKGETTSLCESSLQKLVLFSRHIVA